MPYLCTPSSKRTPPGFRAGSRRHTIASGSMSSVIPSDALGARGVDAHQRGLADRPRVEQRLGLHDGRVVEEVLGDPEGGPGPGHRRRDAIGLGHRDRQRLLTRHVLARGERGHDLVGVHPRGREQLHRVHRGVVQHLREVGIQTRRDPPLGGPPLRPLGPRVAERDHVAARVLEIPRRVEPRDVAASDDGQPQAVHGSGSRQAGSLSPSGGAATSKALTTPHSIAK